MGASIIGWGSALPDQVVTNADFEARLDTSNEWIVERTGIRERHIGGSTGALAIEAARAAMKEAEVVGDDVDLLILATTTPDQAVPATSSSVHDALELQGGAFDLNAACAGFVYALVTANALLPTFGPRAVVIGADALSKVTDFEDRSTAVLFGDGAGAVVIEHSEEAPPLILAHDLGVEGDAGPLLYADHGGYLRMDGKEVYRRAVRAELLSITKVFEKSGLGPDDIALFIPHQANLRIIEAVNSRMGIAMEKTVIVLDHTGNTSASSIPLGLCEAANQGRIKDGDLLLLSGFGAGMTWASAIVRWGAHTQIRLVSARTVLVTGGSRGIGLACARRFQKAGDRVAVTYVTAPPPTTGDPGDEELLALSCDVTDPKAVDDAFAQIESSLGPVEVLVCSAGVTDDGLLLKMSEERWLRVIETNLSGSFRTTKRAIGPMLKARNGRIVLVASIVGLLGNAGQTNYAASKAGLIGFGRSLAREVAARSVTVNVVAPGLVATDMLAAVSEAQAAELAKQVPLGRIAGPDEIAEAVFFLASQQAAYITGAVLSVDGGLGMGN